MSSPPERYRIKRQAASHLGAAFSFAALAHSRHARTARRIPTEPSRLCHAMSRLPHQTPHHSPRSPPNLLWYTGTLRVEIADSGNSPCEIAVFRPQNDHLARGIPDNGYFNPCFGAWRRLSGLGMVSLRSRGLSGLRRVAEEHACWPTCVGYECGARPDITRVMVVCPYL